MSAPSPLSDTTRTDAFEESAWERGLTQSEWASELKYYARQLERELNECKATNG